MTTPQSALETAGEGGGVTLEAEERSGLLESNEVQAKTYRAISVQRPIVLEYVQSRDRLSRTELRPG